MCIWRGCSQIVEEVLSHNPGLSSHANCSARTAVPWIVAGAGWCRQLGIQAPMFTGR